jgi:hypothetical protein
MWLGMDWKKVERVRWLMKRGDYTHPAFLISTIETDFDRFGDQLLSDMNELAERANKTSRLNEALWNKRLHCRLAGFLACR